MDRKLISLNNDRRFRPLDVSSSMSPQATRKLEFNNNSPCGLEWKQDMEKRIERMEKTLDRAANIMNSYFGESSHEAASNSPFKDLTNSQPKQLQGCTLKALPAHSVSECVCQPSCLPRLAIQDPCHGSILPDSNPDSPVVTPNLTNNSAYYAPYKNRRRSSRNFLEHVRYQPNVGCACSPQSSNEDVENLNTPTVTTVTVTPTSRRVDIKINVSQQGVTSINFET